MSETIARYWRFALGLWSLAACAVAQSLSGPGLSVRHDAGLEGAARRVVEEAPAMLRDIERRLRRRPLSRELTVVVVRDHDRFNEVITEHGGRPKGEHVAAVAFSHHALIILKARGWSATGSTFEQIMQHELVHIVLGEWERAVGRDFVPTWLDEGVAQWISNDVFGADDDVLATAVAADELLPFEELERAFPEREGASALAYAQSLSLVRFISRWGAEDEEARANIAGLLRLLSEGRTLDEALRLVTSRGLDDVIAAWQGELHDHRFRLTLANLPRFVMTGMLVVCVLLAWVTVRERRRRRLVEMDAVESETADPAS